MAAVVQFGPFRFRTKAELYVVREAFITKTPASGMTLVGSSMNGQSFQWALGSTGTYTDEELGDHLAAAYNSLGIYTYGTPSGNRSAARFS